MTRKDRTGAPEDGLLTYAQAAVRLGLAEQTIRNWKVRQCLPFPYVKLGDAPNAPVRFEASDLDAYIAERRVEPGS